MGIGASHQSGPFAVRSRATQDDRKVQYILSPALGLRQKQNQTGTSTVPNPRKIQEAGKPAQVVAATVDGQKKHRRKIQQVFGLVALRALGRQLVA